jgi:hypothetical protein
MCLEIILLLSIIYPRKEGGYLAPSKLACLSLANICAVIMMRAWPVLLTFNVIINAVL